MRRTIERKFKDMSPLERHREVLRMQRIERAARALLDGLKISNPTAPASPGRYTLVSAAKTRDLADALGMYEPIEVAKSSAKQRRD